MARELARTQPQAPGLTRRSLLQRAAGLGLAASTLGALELLAELPEQALAGAGSGLPEIQFQIEKRLPKPSKIEGVKVRFGPVYTLFVTIALARTPAAADQTTLARALARVEQAYPFSPSGVLSTLAYGIP